MCGLKDSDCRFFPQVGDLTMLQDMLGKEILPKYHHQVGWRIIDLFQNDGHCKWMLIVRWASPQQGVWWQWLLKRRSHSHLERGGEMKFQQHIANSDSECDALYHVLPSIRLRGEGLG